MRDIGEMIRTEGLVKRFDGLTAVDGISFDVKEGEVFGFLGPNGAGKTTTVRMITGILKPDAGAAWINGKNVEKNTVKAKQDIGIAPEVANAYIDLTGWQNMMLMGELYGIPKREREKRSEELMEIFGLTDRKHDKTKGYSKGMKKRLLLAMAMVNDPSVLFLDEPIAGLDVQSQRLIKRRIKQLNEEGKTVFLTTHNIPVANELCDRVAVINHGKIAAIDSPEKLKKEIKSIRKVEVSFESGISIELLKELEGAERVEKSGDKYKIITPKPVEMIELLIELSKKHDNEIISVQTLGPSLEDVFVDLTGGED